MFTVLSVLYVFVCFALIGVVLLQSGKGGGLGGIGGGASQQVFGGAGAGNILTKVTALLAIAFMSLSVFLSVISSSGDRALERAAQAADQAPTLPQPKQETIADDTAPQQPDPAPADTAPAAP